jgi:hypothetical protein
MPRTKPCHETDLILKIELDFSQEGEKAPLLYITNGNFPNGKSGEIFGDTDLHLLDLESIIEGYYKKPGFTPSNKDRLEMAKFLDLQAIKLRETIIFKTE